MTQPRPRPATPADLAQLKQQLGGGTTAPPRPRGTRDALFGYAYLGHIRTADERRRNSGTSDCFDQLATLAEHEDWDGLDATAEGGMGILKNYVKNTFAHIQEHGQIRETADGSRCVFNTGLFTHNDETIYGMFVRNTTGPQPWRLEHWYAESHRTILNNFSPLELPARPRYTDDPGDYVYDWTCRLVVSADHVAERNRERFPSASQSSPLATQLMLEGAVKRAEKRVQRSYKAAVPFWYVKEKKVQLLLPLSLVDPGQVDLALVVSREGEYYRGHTVLTTAMAYSNARLLTRPDSDWLRPVSAADDASDET